MSSMDLHHLNQEKTCQQEHRGWTHSNRKPEATVASIFDKRKKWVPPRCKNDSKAKVKVQVSSGFDNSSGSTGLAINVVKDNPIGFRGVQNQTTFLIKPRPSGLRRPIVQRRNLPLDDNIGQDAGATQTTARINGNTLGLPPGQTYMSLSTPPCPSDARDVLDLHETAVKPPSMQFVPETPRGLDCGSACSIRRSCGVRIPATPMYRDALNSKMTGKVFSPLRRTEPEIDNGCGKKGCCPCGAREKGSDVNYCSPLSIASYSKLDSSSDAESETPDVITTCSESVNVHKNGAWSEKVSAGTITSSSPGKMALNRSKLSTSTEHHARKCPHLEISEVEISEVKCNCSDAYCPSERHQGHITPSKPASDSACARYGSIAHSFCCQELKHDCPYHFHRYKMDGDVRGKNELGREPSQVGTIVKLSQWKGLDMNGREIVEGSTGVRIDSSRGSTGIISKFLGQADALPPATPNSSATELHKLQIGARLGTCCTSEGSGSLVEVDVTGLGVDGSVSIPKGCTQSMGFKPTVELAGNVVESPVIQSVSTYGRTKDNTQRGKAGRLGNLESSAAPGVAHMQSFRSLNSADAIPLGKEALCRLNNSLEQPQQSFKVREKGDAGVPQVQPPLSAVGTYKSCHHHTTVAPTVTVSKAPHCNLYEQQTAPTAVVTSETSKKQLPADSSGKEDNPTPPRKTFGRRQGHMFKSASTGRLGRGAERRGRGREGKRWSKAPIPAGSALVGVWRTGPVISRERKWYIDLEGKKHVGSGAYSAAQKDKQRKRTRGTGIADHTTIMRSAAQLETAPSSSGEELLGSRTERMGGAGSEETETFLHKDALNLETYGIPEEVVLSYSSRGVKQLFLWQAHCLRVDEGKALSGGNLVYCAPTSGGKTLVAEVLLLRALLQHKGTMALFVVPFISLAEEKRGYFEDVWASLQLRVKALHGADGGDSMLFEGVHVAVCTIERANSIVNRLMEEGRLEAVSIIIVDEVHLIGDGKRGFLLEVMLAKLCMVCPATVQLVCLSATLPNMRTIADWLKASLFTTLYRPVGLDHFVCRGRKVYSPNPKGVRLGKEGGNGGMLKVGTVRPMNGTTRGSDPDGVVDLVKDALERGMSVLVFCATRPWCQSLAMLIARELYKCKRITTSGSLGEGHHRHTLGQEQTQVRGRINNNNNISDISDIVREDKGREVKTRMQESRDGTEEVGSSILVKAASTSKVGTKNEEKLEKLEGRERTRAVIEKLRETPVGLDPDLAMTVVEGVAFHHGGLVIEERSVLEDAFREGTIRVIVATSTLAAGVNLPAQRVIVRSPTIAGQNLDSARYHQMAGRAGRMGVRRGLEGKNKQDGTGGESFLIIPAHKKLEIATDLIVAPLKPLESVLHRAAGGGLERALLEVVVSGVVKSALDARRFVSHTLFAVQATMPEVEAACSSALLFLFENSFVIQGIQGCNHMGKVPVMPLAKYFVQFKEEGHTGGSDANQQYRGEEPVLKQRRVRGWAVMRSCSEKEGNEEDHSYEKGTILFNYQAVMEPTQLGKATFFSGMSPCDALDVHQALHHAGGHLVLTSELHALYLLTPPSSGLEPDWKKFRDVYTGWGEGDPARAVGKAVGIQEGVLVNASVKYKPPYGVRSYSWPGSDRVVDLLPYRRFFAALVLEQVRF
ncbi:unnamed protein product [Choristocarpus tenellus]